MTFGKTLFIASIFVFNFALNVHAQQKPSNLNKIADAIAQSNRLYSQGFEKHQAELVIDRYSTDGAIMAPNAQAITSREGFLAFFNGGYEHGIRKVTFHTINVFGFSGDFVNEEGSYELKDEKGQIMDRGKYMVVWKKTKSGWKMYRDIFNTDLIPSK
jgi:ketosteroid isomerase-like protein